MNYRHAFHAGNFADVVKHATLALVIEHLKLKAAPFRVIDTHAGAGLYDLASSEAQRTGEWRDGIGRLVGPGAAPLPPVMSALLAPYLDAVQSFNPAGALACYPGSPCLALALLRPGDVLIANELHPDDRAALASATSRDSRCKVLALDAWQALKALLPPKERRGIVLVDPPFEEAGEFERLAAGLAAAKRRFATGVFMLWYPIKDATLVTRFQRSLDAQGHEKLLHAELSLRAVTRGEKLSATGLSVVNAPFRLEEQLASLLPFLAERLAQGPGATSRLVRSKS